jgi:ribosomal protein L34
VTLYRCELKTPGGRTVAEQRREILDVAEGDQLKAHLMAMLKAKRIKPQPGFQIRVYTVTGRTMLVATVTL